MTKNIKTYYNCKCKRKQIDDLLSKNASYQAQNQCVNMSLTEKKKLNSYCNANFIRPIKDIDEVFFNQIKFASY